MTPFLALFGGALTIALRGFTAFVLLGTSIHFLLRRTNSNSMIRKVKKTCNRWDRVSLLCFWNAKTSNEKMLRFLISLRVCAILTWGIPSLIAILYCVNPAFLLLYGHALRCAVAFDSCVILISGHCSARFLDSLYSSRKRH